MNSKYQNGKIYCIWSYETDEIYIGSTCRTLKRRLQSHKSSYRGFLKKTKHSHYTSSYEILKYDNVEIGIIEEYPCNNKEELYRREGELQQQIKCVNKLTAGFPQTKDYNKKYYEKNRDEILEQRKDKIFKDNDNQKRRERNRKNPEKNRQQCKKYREKKREKLLQKYNCNCGGRYVYKNKSTHFKTKQHIKWLEENKKLITDNIEDGEEKKE